MIKKSKIACLALITAVGVASPALAQSRQNGFSSWPVSDYERAAASSHARVDPDSASLTGGGSLGYNRLLHEFY
jgi:hypothetical protein